MQNRRFKIIRSPSILLLVVALIAVAALLAWQIHNTYAMQDTAFPGGGTQVPNGQPGKWDLIFTDEFDSQALDANKWTTCYWWDKQGCTNEGNQNLNWYLPGNVTLQDGALHLTARKEQVQASDGKTYNYTSGMVTTGRSVDNTLVPAKFAFQYGYVEVRAKIPKGQGLWPALWLLPADHISKPEIDIMEVLGHETDVVNMNFHYRDANGNRARSKGEWKGEEMAGDWHTYAVNWQPDKITWYIDGVERRTFTDKAHIPSEPMYLIMNLAVGGDWPGSPGAETPFPSQFEVDYVRIWKQNGDVNLLPTADTYVDASAPDKNFGKDKWLAVDGDPLRMAFFKFNLSELSGKKIAHAWLRVRTTGDETSGSANSQAVYLTNTNWSENRLTYNDNLSPNGYIIGLLNKSEPNIIFDIPLEPTEIQKYAGKEISLALVGKGYDGIYVYSREFRPLYPELIISFEASKSAGGE